VTTRPIHKLVLVVPVEEQTIEDLEDPEDSLKDKKEEAGVQEDLSSGNIEEESKEREAELEGLLQAKLNTMVPRETVPEEENGERTSYWKESPEGQEGGQERTAEDHPRQRAI
jgi:hypothetical protein